ncbi:hypothetical protein BIY29_07695 [Brenneria alni]|uniref:DUF2531 family protein n=1 Tax=Brenneria alni TaxID=71656 RepID=A0A421DQ07_9GAMM|nr:HofP DNA utilization family protein [Brenneria alni]RLM25140.1 hypothetical protein BIY29_07695 [Brenneria alni]
MWNRIIGAIYVVLFFIVLFSIVAGVAANVSRDPFHPVSAERCTRVDDMQQWQLKGVIGSGERWVGWLAQSESQWQRVKEGEAIPPGSWQVSRLDKSGMRLTSIDHAAICDGMPSVVTLSSPFINKRIAQ